MSFYVGQKVVCVEGGNLINASGVDPHLIKDKIYTISGIWDKPCGHIALDVGLQTTNCSGVMCVCGIYYHESSSIHWCAAKRFIPLDEYSAMETEIQESLKPQYQEH